MAKIRIKGDTSGYVDIQAPAAAGTTTLNLPTSNGDIVTTAGAVFTGDVTVDTNTFHVDTTNNRVGIGTASPSRTLTVNSGATNTAIVLESTDANVGIAFDDGTKVSTINGGTDGIVFYPETGTEGGRFDSSGNFRFNSGYGSVATAYGCRAWVNFNGEASPLSINGSGNVSSVSDDGTGKYTINFSNSMPDTNYIFVSGMEDGGAFNDLRAFNHEISSTRTTSAYAIYFVQEGGGLNDPHRGHIAFFR